MVRSEIVLGLPDYEVTDFEIRGGGIRIAARHTGERTCPHCGGKRLRNKERYVRCGMRIGACGTAFWSCRPRSFNAGTAGDTFARDSPGFNPVNDPRKPSRR